MEEYLSECLDSILRQSLKDIEIICIDDGSMDNTLVLIKIYAEKDKRIKLFTQKNKGAGAARNNGIKMSVGEFVIFMDPDDFYPENTILEKLYDNAVKNDVQICGGSFSTIDKHGNINYVYHNNYVKYTFTKNEKIQYSDYQFDYGYHRFIYNRDFLIRNNIFFPDLKRFQDPPFFINTMIKAKEFYAIKDVVYRYRNGYKSIEWTNEKILHLLEGLTYNLQTSKQHDLWKLHYLTFDRFVKEFIPKLSSIRIWQFFFKLIKIRLIIDRKYVNTVFYRKFRRFIINVFFETILSVKSNSDYHIVFTLFGIQFKFFKKMQFDSTIRIAILNNQGFGDCLMETAFWSEVKKQIPNITIDYFTRSYAAFARNPLFDMTAPYIQKPNYKKYDLVLLNDRLYIVKKYNNTKIKAKAPLLAGYIDETVKIVKSLSNMNYSIIANFAALFGKNRRGHFDIHDIFSYDTNTKPYISWDLDAFAVLEKYKLKQYITLSRAVDSIFENGHIKMWPLEYYNKLAKSLKKKYPDIKLVQLGANNDYGLIEGVDINLLSKTSFDELNVLLKYSLLHIDSEGGLVHLKNALGGKSCIMFGPTSSDIFGYCENINIESTACRNACSHLLKHWQQRCPRGFNEPVCMYSIKPKNVASRVKSFINSLETKRYEFQFRNKENLVNLLNSLCNRIALLTDNPSQWLCEIEHNKNIIDIYTTDTRQVYNVRQKIYSNHHFYQRFDYNITKPENTYDFIFVDINNEVKYEDFFYMELCRVLKNNGKCLIVSEEEFEYLLEFNKQNNSITRIRVNNACMQSVGNYSNLQY
jgi:glycosyltransferase involved in cell wall biosynthesis/ADP-heptose:LPS heptosyltransferase